MASVARDPGGFRRIVFKGGDGKRRAIRLGKVTQETALSVKVRVERLIAAQITGHALDNETANWVANLEQVLADKLAVAGLIAARDVAVLGPFIDSYMKGRTDIQARTVDRLTRAFQHLRDFFGNDQPLREITPGDCEELGRHLRKTLGENTVRKRLSQCKQLFRFAVRKRLIVDTPFAEMKGLSVTENRSRDYFLTTEDAAKVVDQCHDNEMKLIFALCRWGGLRCPSEVLELKWADIDWERSRMRVRSPKTERHAGKEFREVPIFPEVRPYLDTAFEEPPDGRNDFVIKRTRSNEANLRTYFRRAVIRAGLQPWPKLLQNLRASRATELAKDHPAHVAADWLGHSTLVARKFYWRTTDADFSKAISKVTPPKLPAQNTAQQAGEMGCIEVNGQPKKSKNPEKYAISGVSESAEYSLRESNPCYRTENPGS